MKKQAGGQPRIPERRCAGCGERFPKKELVRIVCGEGGIAVTDPSMKAQSRGVYVCRNEKCLAKALKGGRIASAVGAKLDEDAVKLIRAAVTAEGDAQ